MKIKIIHPLNLFDKYKDWKFERKMKKQRYKRGYSDQDCWSMHYWLTETFPKMIYNLRDMKHGAPFEEFKEFENLPLEWINIYALKFTKQIENESKKGEDYDYTDSICFFGGTLEDRCFCRWWIILSRIAWCLEQASLDLKIYNEFEEEFNNQFLENKNLKTYTIKESKIDEELKRKYFNKEKEIQEEKEKYKDEALDLIKKYFYNLWD